MLPTPSTATEVAPNKSALIANSSSPVPPATVLTLWANESDGIKIKAERIDATKILLVNPTKDLEKLGHAIEHNLVYIEKIKHYWQEYK